MKFILGFVTAVVWIIVFAICFLVVLINPVAVILAFLALILIFAIAALVLACICKKYSIKGEYKSLNKLKTLKEALRKRR